MEPITTSSIEKMEEAGARLYNKHIKFLSEEQKKKEADVESQRIKEDKMFPELTKMFYSEIFGLVSSTNPHTETQFLKKDFTNLDFDESEMNIFRRWFAHMCDKQSRFLSLPNGRKLEPFTGVKIDVNDFEKSLFLVKFTSSK